MVPAPQDCWLWDLRANRRSPRRSVTSPAKFCHGSPDSGYGSSIECVHIESPRSHACFRNICGLDGQQVSQLRHVLPSRERYRQRGLVQTSTKVGKKKEQVETVGAGTIHSNSINRISPLTPDRFIPFRAKYSAPERYHTTKSLASHSNNKKSLQRDLISQDPFIPQVRRNSSLPAARLRTLEEYQGSLMLFSLSP